MARERQVTVTTHGHYLVEPAAGGGGPLLVGFHGYGENARVHLEALRAIPGSDRWTLAAVQGLHLFYRQSTGEVVSSWMTSFQRELAMADNVRYVGAVLDELRCGAPAGPPPVFAGFSQGVAMAYRAAARAGHGARGILALAGDVPPDLGPAELGALPPVLLGRGNDDRWYDASKLEADLARLAAASVEAGVCRFTGGHEWTAEFRAAAGEFLTRLAAGSA